MARRMMSCLLSFLAGGWIGITLRSSAKAAFSVSCRERSSWLWRRLRPLKKPRSLRQFKSTQTNRLELSVLFTSTNIEPVCADEVDVLDDSDNGASAAWLTAELLFSSSPLVASSPLLPALSVASSNESALSSERLPDATPSRPQEASSRPTILCRRLCCSASKLSPPALSNETLLPTCRVRKMRFSFGGSAPNQGTVVVTGMRTHVGERSIPHDTS